MWGTPVGVSERCRRPARAHKCRLFWTPHWTRSQPGKRAGAAAPQGRTAPGSHHVAVSTHVSSLLGCLHVLKSIETTLPSCIPQLPGSPWAGDRSAFRPGHGNPTRTQPTNPKHDLGQANQRKTQKGQEAMEAAMVQGSGDQLGAGPNQPPTNRVSCRCCADLSRPQFPCV